jgi:hypothetical protein
MGCPHLLLTALYMQPWWRQMHWRPVMTCLLWLCAACTCWGIGGSNHAALPIVNLSLTDVHPPGAVYEFLMAKVQADLPDMHGAGILGLGAPET